MFRQLTVTPATKLAIESLPVGGAVKRTDSFVGYSGETTNELLGYPATGQDDSLVRAFEEGLQRKARRRGEHALNEEERPTYNRGVPARGWRSPRPQRTSTVGSAGYRSRSFNRASQTVWPLLSPMKNTVTL